MRTMSERKRYEMKIHLAIVLGVAMAGSAFMVCAAEHPATERPKEEKKATVTTSVYVCPDCEAMALKAGKCDKCGKELVQKHLLGTKDGQAMLCDCGASCTCDAKGIKDGKCGCGKEIKTMSSKGMYVCPMGCPDISKTPGKCACGMDMKQSE